jgi:hypothetical protein
MVPLNHGPGKTLSKDLRNNIEPRKATIDSLDHLEASTINDECDGQ